MKFKNISIVTMALFLSVLSSTVNAGVIFSFQDDNGNVTMTTSGSLDTSLLISTNHGGWGSTGFGTFTNNLSLDMIGTDVGNTDIAFTFSPGTDTSAWNAGSFILGGADFFGFSDNGTTGFHTYASDNGYIPGVGISSSDLVGSIWTPNNEWLALSVSTAGIGLIDGVYTIADVSSGESITIFVNRSISVPEPAALGLFGLGLIAMRILRRS
jgi:hypothetical protein